MYSELKGFVVGRAISRAKEEEQTVSGGGGRSLLKRSSGIQETKKRCKRYEMIALIKGMMAEEGATVCDSPNLQGFAPMFWV